MLMHPERRVGALLLTVTTSMVQRKMDADSTYKTTP